MPSLDLVTRSSAWAHASALLRETDDETVRDMCDATAIPSPTGHEARRGTWFAGRLRELGLHPEQDEAGNVFAVTPAAQPGARRLVVASHLDTVFSADTDLTLKRDGERILAPGISDNSRGLAALLALGRALRAAGWPLHQPLVMLGSTGEEGAGDLRGVKHYFSGHADETASFIALDGAGAERIINVGVGSRRLRVEFEGPGGHSWSDWGAPNAVHAVSRAINELASLTMPASPRTTLSVGRIGGGTSINSIPSNAWFEVDLRSEGMAQLQELEREVRRIIDEARRAEAATSHMTVAVTVFGDRPAGSTPADHPLVLAAREATAAIGLKPEFASSSTDANVPMSLRIPAIAIGAGGDAGGMHTTGEWYDNHGGAAGIERALLTVLQVAGLP